jgi:AAA domain
MPNEEDQMSFEIWCDLLERELKIALEDLEKIRKSAKAEAKNTCHMLRAALGNARHYLSEIQDSLKNWSLDGCCAESGEAAAAIRKLTGQDLVKLAPTASAVQTLKEAGYTADTVANFQDKIEFHDAARGRVIWCDEASLLDNKDFTWLLNFVRDNGCGLICSGDPRQHGAVERGHPYKSGERCSDAR